MAHLCSSNDLIQLDIALKGVIIYLQLQPSYHLALLQKFDAVTSEEHVNWTTEGAARWDKEIYSTITMLVFIT